MYSSTVTKTVLGVATASIMAGTVVIAGTAFPGNQAIGFLSVLCIPLAISLLITRNFIDGLTIVWLNEVFFAVTGTWVKIGPLPGRGLLLFVVLLAYIAFSKIRIRRSGHLNKTTLVIVFYGLLLPSFLFLYGTILGGASVSNALSDVMRFGTVLMYFPIRDLFRRHFDLCSGWLIAASSIISLLFVAMAVGPDTIRIPLLVNWMSGGDVNSQFNRPGSEIIRAGLTPIILCYIGVFVGLMHFLDSKSSVLLQLCGLILTLVSILPFIVNFVRGSILAIGLTFLCVGILSFLHKMHRNKSLRVAALMVFLLLSGYWVSINYLPISLTKWVVADQSISNIIDPVRIEQTERMLDAWLEEPILGKGVGMPLKDYSRDESGLAFEVQYPMVLYRVGLFGFTVIMIPFGVVIIRTVRLWLQRQPYLESRMGKLHMAIALATLSLLIASWTNPYFATVMCPLFIVMFFALNKLSVQVQMPARES